MGNKTSRRKGKGCIKDDHPTLYNARAVSDYRDSRKSGVGWVILQVANRELIVWSSNMNQKITTWPIRCMQKYQLSVDGRQLIIRAGPQTETGVGVFLFQCTRAREVYEKLDESWNSFIVDEQRKTDADRQRLHDIIKHAANYHNTLGSTPLLPGSQTMHQSSSSHSRQVSNQSSAASNRVSSTLPHSIHGRYSQSHQNIVQNNCVNGYNPYSSAPKTPKISQQTPRLPYIGNPSPSPAFFPQGMSTFISTSENNLASLASTPTTPYYYNDPNKDPQASKSTSKSKPKSRSGTMPAAPISAGMPYQHQLSTLRETSGEQSGTSATSHFQNPIFASQTLAQTSAVSHVSKPTFMKSVKRSHTHNFGQERFALGVGGSVDFSGHIRLQAPPKNRDEIAQRRSLRKQNSANPSDSETHATTSLGAGLAAATMISNGITAASVPKPPTEWLVQKQSSKYSNSTAFSNSMPSSTGSETQVLSNGTGRSILKPLENHHDYVNTRSAGATPPANCATPVTGITVLSSGGSAGRKGSKETTPSHFWFDFGADRLPNENELNLHEMQGPLVESRHHHHHPRRKSPAINESSSLNRIVRLSTTPKENTPECDYTTIDRSRTEALMTRQRDNLFAH